VQLPTGELEAMWTGRRAPVERRSRRAAAPRAPLPGRSLPLGRADRALQIVLTDASAWGRLSNDDHHLLCELPPPHGPVFAWLDAQVLEHGPQPWPVLRQALQGHACEPAAVELIARMPADIESDPAELTQILARERDRRLDELKSELAARAPTDPVAYEQLKQLVAQPKIRGEA
jgi:DNA primase